MELTTDHIIMGFLGAAMVFLVVAAFISIYEFLREVVRAVRSK